MSNSKAESVVPSSAETVGSNYDLLTEILLRAPAKPLLRFKCVAQKWLSLISDPKFCVSHTRHQKSLNPTPNALLLSCHYSSTPQFQLVPLKDTTQVPFLDYLNEPLVKIEQSCNGLLLCSSWIPSNLDAVRIEEIKTQTGFDFAPYEPGYKYFICNPTTKQFKRLVFPDDISQGFSPKETSAFLTLAFDPLNSPYYKVIYLRPVDDYEIDVYSSETESWTQTRIHFPWMRGTGVFCNGAVHWHKEQTSPYFLVDDETLKTMPMPPVPFELESLIVNYFGESDGHLCMIVSNDSHDLPLQFDVWEMASDYSLWYVRYHVDLRSVSTFLPKQDHGQDLPEFSVLSIIRDRKEEESTIVLFQKGGRAISYNLCEGTATKLCDLEPRPGFELDYEGYDAYQYFDTLACV